MMAFTAGTGNLNDRDVTVTLETAGFFAEGRLFLPDAPPERIAIPTRQSPAN
jgi:hypothetical protein